MKTTQCTDILAYLAECGSINRIQAFEELGIFELAARIADLEKDGHHFSKETCHGISRRGRPFRYTTYRLE